MRKHKDIVVCGSNYQLIQMPATKRSEILGEIKHLAFGAKEGISDFRDGVDTKIDLTKAIAGIFERLTPKKGAELLRDIIMNGVQFPIMKTVDDYDEHFGEFYHHQIDLVTEIIEFNFGESVQEIKKKLSRSAILTKIFSKV